MWERGVRRGSRDEGEGGAGGRGKDREEGRK